MTSTEEPSTADEGLEITFDPDDEADREKASRAIEDLLEKGYKIIVHVDGEDLPFDGFDDFEAQDREYTAYRVLEKPTNR
jgi:hypothetical protein